MPHKAAVHLITDERTQRTRCGMNAWGSTQPENVTCKTCRKLAGLGVTWAQEHARKLSQSNPTGALDVALLAAPVVLPGWPSNPKVMVMPKETLADRKPPKRAEHSTPHTDNAAIDYFANVMKARMRKMREKGRSGWDDPKRCSMQTLRDGLKTNAHAQGSSVVDAANYAMMIYIRILRGG